MLAVCAKKQQIPLNSTKEPAPRIKLPSTVKGDRGRARTVKLVPRSVSVSVGELDPTTLDTADRDPDA